MPAPLDLTGRRFGSLIVVSRDGEVKFGRLQSAWLCRCDCGNTIRLPRDRLPHRASLNPRHITACDACRSHPCVVCGAPIHPSSSSSTCSSKCATERKRAVWRSNYYRYSEDPSWVAAKRAASKIKYQWLIKSKGRAAINREAREAHAKRMENPDYREKWRQKSAAWVAAHPDHARKLSRDHARKRRRQATAKNITHLIETIDK